MLAPLLNCLTALVLLGTMLLATPGSATAATESRLRADRWLCDGDLLSLTTTSGAVDLQGLSSPVPNVQDGTVPGDGVLISWRGTTFQLPRTNNAGAPSYTDGRWWWRAADPLHPEWKQRRGAIISYACSLPSETTGPQPPAAVG